MDSSGSASPHRSTSNFQEHLVQKEDKEALGKGHKGRDMKRSCRTWGSIVHGEQKELPPEIKANDTVKGKRAVRKKGALKQATTGSLSFSSDFSHYLIKWDQPVSSTALPAYIRKERVLTTEVSPQDLPCLSILLLLCCLTSSPAWQWEQQDLLDWWGLSTTSCGGRFVTAGSPLLVSPAGQSCQSLGGMGLVPSTAWGIDIFSCTLNVELMDRRMMWMLTPPSLVEVRWERF